MLSTWLAEFSGLQMFDGRLFRGGASAVLAGFLVIWLMPKFIKFLQKIDASSDFTTESVSKTPPIMGGMLLVFTIIACTLIFAKPNGYTISIVCILIAYSTVGAIDDVMKIINKKKVLSGAISKKDFQDKADGLSSGLRLGLYFFFSLVIAISAYKFTPGITGHLTVPFIKPEIWHPYLPWWAFIGMICFVTTATANGANFTDGIDSLLSIPIITTSIFVGIVAYISGNAIFSDYLLIPFHPGVDELVPIAAAIVGSTLAYLWYNSPPADIYMGDGGSIGIGGAIGMMFVFIHAELFLPIVGIVFVAEAFSSFAQIGYFKLTRKMRADGQGQRIFLRAPLHEHYKIKWKDKFGSRHELLSKIAWRFHLVSIFALIVGALIFFKIR